MQWIGSYPKAWLAGDLLKTELVMSKAKEITGKPLKVSAA
jgi:hypothetical protein